MRSLYFAYGSNLNREDWHSWCGRHGYAAGLLSPAFPAYLPDRQLSFSHYSSSRRGGVLDVLPRLGYATPGYVFEVQGDGWEALDEKEGVNKEGVNVAYRRLKTVCLRLDSAEHAVETYEVAADRRLAHVDPAEEYLAVVEKGCAQCGLDPRGLESPELLKVDGLFLYGTLMRGEDLHPVIERADPRIILPSRARGRLVDFGAYPGLVPAPEHENSWVQGEFVRMGRLDAIRELDEAEEFRGFGKPGSLFRRALTLATVDGNEELAWVYLAASALEARHRPIESGDWRRRQSGRSAGDFMVESKRKSKFRPGP